MAPPFYRLAYNPPAWLQQVLLAAFVLLVYSPAFFAEPSVLDDARLLGTWRDSSAIAPLELFKHTGGVYYRPLIGISNWIDSTLWNMHPVALHAENILLHLLNSLLVFWLIRTLLQRAGSVLPLLGGLLFGLHPITTESVNWISGRTDVLAASGLLGATLCLVTWKNSKLFWHLVAALICLLVGLLSKEAAWGFLISIPLLFFPRDKSTCCSLHPRWIWYAVAICLALAFLLATVTLSFWPVLGLSVVCWGMLHHLFSNPSTRTWQRSLLITLVVTAALGVVLATGMAACKQLMLANPFSHTGQALLNMVTAPDKALQLTSMAAAFYVKKFFIPVPLSLAITEIHPYYILGGILVIFLLAWLCAVRTMTAALLLTGIFLLLPALPLAYGTIAWTPYAERYIYIPAAFWVTGFLLATSQAQNNIVRRSITLFVILLIPLAGYATVTRSVVWQSNLTLFEDTAHKASKHLESQGIYMVTLMLNGQLDQARKQHYKIQAMADGPIAMKYAYNYAYLAYVLGNSVEANEVLVASLTRWAPVAGPKVTSAYNAEWRKMFDVHVRLSKDLKQQTLNF